MKIILTLALVISGCATMVPGVATYTSPSWLDDSDYARMEQPGVAYACALRRMGIDEAPGPVPRVVEVDSSWINTYATRAEWVSAEYVWETNTIYIFPRMHDYYRELPHEMAHAIQFQLGEEFSEAEAKKVADYAHHCVIFGGM